MELTLDALARCDWACGDVRMKFRRDGTGFYEREAAQSTPFVHENLLHRVEGETLHLKFAHARSWTEVGAEFDGAKIMLAHDPYALVFQERTTAPLALEPERAQALPE